MNKGAYEFYPSEHFVIGKHWLSVGRKCEIFDMEVQRFWYWKGIVSFEKKVLLLTSIV